MLTLKCSNSFAKTGIEKINLGPSQTANFVLCSVVVFVWVNRSTFILELSRMSRFKMVKKICDEFVIFHQKIEQV